MDKSNLYLYYVLTKEFNFKIKIQLKLVKKLKKLKL